TACAGAAEAITEQSSKLASAASHLVGPTVARHEGSAIAILLDLPHQKGNFNRPCVFLLILACFRHHPKQVGELHKLCWHASVRARRTAIVSRSEQPLLIGDRNAPPCTRANCPGFPQSSSTFALAVSPACGSSSFRKETANAPGPSSTAQAAQ